MYTLILASQSPRRKELLEIAGYEFKVISSEISEILNENLSLEDQIRELARQKARAVADGGKLLKSQRNIILSADTVVVFQNQVLGKPTDSNQARKFLRQLSGQTHSVITAVCFLDVESDREVVVHDWSNVTFRVLGEDEIERYVQTGDPLDKAGAYGIQGVGKTFVSQLEGSFENVMGLPVQLVEKTFEEYGWQINRRKSR